MNDNIFSTDGEFVRLESKLYCGGKTFAVLIDDRMRPEFIACEKIGPAKYRPLSMPYDCRSDALTDCYNRAMEWLSL